MSQNFDVFLSLSRLINPHASEAMITVTTTGKKNLAINSTTSNFLRGSLFVHNPTTHDVYIGLTSTVSTGKGFHLSSGAQQEFLMDPAHYQKLYASYDLSTAVDCTLYVRETRAWKST